MHESSSCRLRGLRQPAGGLVALLAAVLLVPATPAVAAGTSTAARAAGPVATTAHRVTLLTGDVVTITDLGDGRTTATVEPKDLVGGGIRSVTVGKDQYVYPVSALPYIADGTLDRELFNVTSLVRQGLDDAHGSTLPLIVQYTSAKAEARSATPDGAVRTRSLESIDATAMTTRKDDAEAFWADVTGNAAAAGADAPPLTQGIAHIWLDARVKATLADTVAQVGAPAAWAAGYDGTGVTVAVLDTGIDDEHPDLAGQIDAEVSFVPGETTRDVNGHGTHVASTVLGTGAASGGTERGVAPGARLLVGKVLSDEGYGLDSWIVDGMEWAATHADIVSMSLGTSEPSDGTDPMSQALNSLSADTGALFVVAAGNTASEQSIGSPGAADAALTVGAVDGTDQLAWFSSQGPRSGDFALKPDLVAPGVDVLAARSQYSPEGSGSYLSLSGTSMATPHVAGAAAVLAQRHPDWTGAQLKDALMSSAKPLEGMNPFQVGAGRLDVAAATLGDVHATGSAFFGFDRWPHPDQAPVTRTVTYRNDGDAVTQLTLDPQVSGSDGSPAPAGLLTLSAASVTVPAHGSTDVSVTLDPAAGAAGQRYAGRLVASTDAGPVAGTDLGFVKEDERYDLTITASDRHGDPALAYVELVGGPYGYDVVAVDGSATLRRPPGTYAVMTWLDVDTETDHQGTALLGNPEVVLDRDRTVSLDARKAREVTATVRRADAQTTYLRMDWYRRIGETAIESNALMPVWTDHVYAQPTAQVTDGDFELNTRWRIRRAALTVAVDGRPLDVIAMPGSAGYVGVARMPVVSAGTGAASDYADLDASGKAVLVTRSADVTPFDRAVAAHDAGAALLLVVNDQAPEFNEWVGGPMGEDPGIPVVAISGAQGARLLESARARRLTASVAGRPSTPWLYDLEDPHPGRIPERLGYAPRSRDLALVTSSYASDRPTDGGEFRFDLRPYSYRAIGFLQTISFPQVRQEWVSAPEGTAWYEEALVLDASWDQRSPRIDYDPGDHVRTSWFSPVARPRIGDGYWHPSRGGDFFSLNIPGWGDSGLGHTGDMYSDPTAHQHMTLYQGSVVVGQSDDQGMWVDAPTPDLAKYRLVNDSSRDPARWTTSTRTHTEWRFSSRSPGDAQVDLPLMSVDYGVATDLAGRVGPGPTTVRLRVIPVPGADLGGKPDRATLQVSYDGGGSWRPTTLTHTGPATWTAVVPRSDATDVSLRVAAWDDAGNSIRQVVIAAYRLR